VLSRNYFLLENKESDFKYMRKLNQKKIKWIVREMDKGKRSVYRIAKTMDITPQWAREIHRIYHERGVYPFPRLPGRKRKTMSKDEQDLILKTREEHPLAGALAIERILDLKGVHIPHNRIHRFLKEEGLSKEEPHKQKRRKWIRYEWRYSYSLWHADWFEKQPDHIILFQDDASRFITGYGVFDHATAQNTIQVLDLAIKSYGVPKQLMTDHGIQFTSLPRETCPDPKPNQFQQFLNDAGIHHIKSRVKHPQSNGKVERLILTIKQLWNHFHCLNMTIYYYNYQRPHSSLENGCLRTPYQAFLDKTRKINSKKAE
jgi:transposase InsO family protein